MKSSNFWRESKIALKTQLYDKFWRKDQITRAWLIAAIETQEDLDEVVSYLQAQEDK